MMLNISTPDVPELRLMAAVLTDALELLVNPIDRARNRALLAETSRWIASDDRRNPFSFLNVCHALDLCPARLRAGIADRLRPLRTTAPRPAGWQLDRRSARRLRVAA